LFRNITSNANPTFMERQIIENSVNEAIQQLAVERGVDAYHFLRTSITATTVALQEYVDLDTDITSIVSGTMRIKDEDIVLQSASLEWIRNVNYDDESDGLPSHYALKSSGDPDVIRLILYPIPDAVYTLDFDVEKMVAEDGTAEFPSWYVGAITDLATSIMIRRLGLGTGTLHYQAYINSLFNIIEQQQGDAPLRVQKTREGYYHSDLQRRAE
jgi:hypothetical protein